MDNYLGLQWHITEKCDQRCKHCYIYAGKNLESCKDMSFAQLKGIFYNYLDTCKRLDARAHITVTGGDPILSKNFWKLLKLFKEHKVSFSILGNPFHITDEVAREMKSYGLKTYQMSLDGLEKTHDFIRKPGSFRETLNKIKVLQNAGIISTIMTTVSKLNMDEIPELVNVVVAYKANRFAFARYCPNPGDYDSIPNPMEYREFLDKMWNKFTQYKDCDTVFSLKDHLWKLYLYEKGLFKIDSIENPEDLIIDGCHCGISHLTVLSDGKVYACRRSETPIGKVPEESIYDIFMGPEMDKYREYDKFKACSKCELKNFCRGCPSVAKCLTGDFYAKDPQCWKKIE